MSNRHIPLAEIQRSQDFNTALAHYLPDTLKNLSDGVRREVNNSVYDSFPNPAGRIPMELILRQKYDYLRKHGHMEALTQDQIDAAKVLSTKQESFNPKN